MIEVTVLGSGSSGNATLVKSPRASILIDAGFSLRQIRQRMAEVGWAPERIDAVLITHEHVDHVRGLRVLCSRHRIPVFATEATHDGPELQQAGIGCPEILYAGEEFEIGDVTVRPFSVPHDASDPLGFILSVDGIRYGHITDLGCVTELVRYHLRGCNILTLETNHDPEMLIDGPYPWFLKQRIMSRLGHLSNTEAAGLLADLAGSDLSALFLAHLSRENNTPKLAAEACRAVLQDLDRLDRIKVHLTDQFTPTETVRLA